MERVFTDQQVREVFADAGDFVARELKCGELTLYAYSVDGLTSGADTSRFIFRPIANELRGTDMEELYRNALYGTIYNNVAIPCKNLQDAALKLVNGFCVVLFPGVGAIAFEVKTGDKRNPAAPALENTVKGPKDAFVETMRTNTSLIRRHLRTPQLRLWQTTVGQRSITNVSVVWIDGITNSELVVRMKRRIESIDIDGLLSPSAVEESQSMD